MSTMLLKTEGMRLDMDATGARSKLRTLLILGWISVAFQARAAATGASRSGATMRISPSSILAPNSSPMPPRLDREGCLVCEAPMERETEQQLVCGKPKCRNALRTGIGFGRYCTGPGSGLKSGVRTDRAGQSQRAAEKAAARR